MAAQGYIGRAPGESSVVVARQTFTPTGITTNFTFASGYTVGYVDAYLNGVRLIEGDDYTATDGSVVGLTTHAISGDVLELVVYKAFNVSNVTGTLGDFSIPDKIVHTNDLDTAIRFPQGDTFTVETAGSEVLRVDANSNVGIGTTNTLAAADPKNQSILNVGVVTANSITAAAGTFGSLNVGGTLTYEDVTNSETAGITTTGGLVVTGLGATFGSGVGIADSIFHIGDDNTQIRFPAADTFTVETAGSERIRVESGGHVGIGTINPNNLLHVFGGQIKAQSDPSDTSTNLDLIRAQCGSSGGALFSIRAEDASDDNSNWDIKTNSNEHLTFTIGGNTERLRIDSSGRLLIGTVSSLQVGSSTPGLQLHNTASANGAMLSIARFNNDTTGGKLVLGKSRNTSIAAGTIVQDDDTIGEIEFAADDGTDMQSRGVQIRAQVDGTPGANDMPGRLVFMTTADGDATSTERLRIDRNGRILKTGTDARSNFFNSTWSPGIQSENTDDKKAALSIVCAGNNPNQGILLLGNTRNASVGGNTLVTNDDGTGIITFQGNDGSDMVETARIESKVDGTPGANDMPGRLVFRTTADGASSSTERLRITSAGLVGINSTSPVSILDVTTEASSNSGINFTNIGAAPIIDFKGNNVASAGRIRMNEASGGGVLQFATKTTGGTITEAFRIDNAQRVLIGPTASGGNGATLQVASSDAHKVQFHRGVASSGGPNINISKSRNTAYGSNTIVQNGDSLGAIRFLGDDGTNLLTSAARILCQVDETPGENDMPGRLIFETTSDGASSETERLRIDSRGSFNFNNGMMIENVNINSTAKNGTQNVDLQDGMVHYFSTNSTGTWKSNFRVSSSANVNGLMSTGDVISPTMIVAKGATSHYADTIQIDGSDVTPEWLGGAPTDGGGSGTFDVYSYTIIKTGDGAFKVFGSVSTYE